MDTHPVYLIESASGVPVEAALHLRLTIAQVVAAEAAWKPTRDALADYLEHGHWDWSLKAPLLDEPGARFMGVECVGLMQGMIAVWETGHVGKLPEQVGAPLVYVEYVESAPCNLGLGGQAPRYRGVGSRLVTRAAVLSRDLGYGGRVGLVALPQAESFYERRCGMTALGRDRGYNRLTYYELTPAGAADLFRRTDS